MGRFNLDKLRAYAVKSVKEAGLPIPEPLPPISEGQGFPSDLTRLTGAQIRELMSFWSGQLARAEFIRARADVVELGAKESVKRSEQRFRILNPEFKQKWEADAALAQDDAHNEMVDKLTLAKAKAMMAKGMVDAFERYWQSLSRELSARISEHEREGRDRAR